MIILIPYNAVRTSDATPKEIRIAFRTVLERLQKRKNVELEVNKHNFKRRKEKNCG